MQKNEDNGLNKPIIVTRRSYFLLNLFQNASNSILKRLARAKRECCFPITISCCSEPGLIKSQLSELSNNNISAIHQHPLNTPLTLQNSLPFLPQPLPSFHQPTEIPVSKSSELCQCVTLQIEVFFKHINFLYLFNKI